MQLAFCKLIMAEVSENFSEYIFPKYLTRGAHRLMDQKWPTKFMILVLRKVLAHGPKAVIHDPDPARKMSILVWPMVDHVGMYILAHGSRCVDINV